MFLLYLPQILFAMVHSVPYNTRIILDLNDGDTISLTDFPKDWEYSRVVLGINSSPSVQMTGNLIVNHCKYSLYSYYREVAFAYTNEIKIKYSGKCDMVINEVIGLDASYKYVLVTTESIDEIKLK